MTWLWRTCFSLVWLAPALAATISGSVDLVDSRDPGVRRHKDYSGVVLWLEPEGPRPALRARPPGAQMVQKGKRFIPHVLAIPAGTTVQFPNFDPIFHNAFSTFSGQIFDVGLYAPGTSRDVEFRRSGVVRVFCNIHPTMSAIIVVLDTPWFAVTGPTGAFTIRDVPPGGYVLRVFHERSSAEKLKALERRISVGGEAVMLPAVTISELGYLAAPHKNKYGKDYPPVIQDQPGYPGARK